MKFVAAAAIVAFCLLPFAACGGSATGLPTSPPPPSIVVAGLVIDRLTKTAIEGSTVTFTGVSTHRAGVSGGRFELEMPPGQYAVSIDGPSHVPHQTKVAYVNGSVELRFSVLRWGPSLFGATYDQTFHEAFHQIARVGQQTVTGIRKWVVAPVEIYLIDSGTIPNEPMNRLREVLEDLNQEALPALWCGLAAGRLTIVTGPEAEETDGRIVVRPNWNEGASGTGARAGPIRSGTVRVNLYRQRDDRIQTRAELAGILLHEFYHVAFGYHVCGGDLGPNPFHFSVQDCPYPDSVMANLGDLIAVLSPQDRLAACIVYHNDTHIGNQFPDVNERYTAQ